MRLRKSKRKSNSNKKYIPSWKSSANEISCHKDNKTTIILNKHIKEARNNAKIIMQNIKAKQAKSYISKNINEFKTDKDMTYTKSDNRNESESDLVKIAKGKPKQSESSAFSNQSSIAVATSNPKMPLRNQKAIIPNNSVLESSRKVNIFNKKNPQREIEKSKEYKHSPYNQTSHNSSIHNEKSNRSNSNSRAAKIDTPNPQ